MPTELAPNASSWTSAQTRAQFAAIAWLRWRIFLNSFRRKGGKGELVARILLYPLFGFVALLPIGGAGTGAYFFAAHQHLNQVFWILWITFGICQILNIQLGQPGTTFDPTQLIRFPLRLRSYTAVRLFFGILTPANIVGTLMSLAVAVGVTIAIPSLWLYALIALFVFAAANVLFSRMIFAWVDRWLSTRRAREIFTALIFVFSLGIQWANFTFNPAYNRHGHGHTSSISPERLALAAHAYKVARPVLAALPPGLTGNSLVAAAASNSIGFLLQTLGCALFATAFLAIFMLRMRTEYRGENLSDVANAVPRPKKTMSASGRLTPSRSDLIAPAAAANSRSSILSALLAKELLYVRRNTGLFYALIAPVVFVFLFAGRLATRGNAAWVFPAAVAYTMLGITPLAFNSFGLEATGAQFYFLAPIRLRDVFLAKNLINFLLSLTEIAAVFAIISHVATMPPLQTIAITLLWAASTLLVSTAIGNRRSLTSPKKISLARAGRKQASGLSALIGVGILMLSAGIGAGLLLLALWLQKDWILVPIFAVFFAAALWFYLRSLTTLDTFALNHRESLFLELCKPD